MHKVDELKSNGKSTKEACAAIGWKADAYYGERSRVKKKGAKRATFLRTPRRKTAHHVLEIPESGAKSELSISGTPSTLAVFVHELSRQFGGRHG